MTSPKFMLLAQQHPLHSSTTETTQPFPHDPLDYSPLDNQANIDANYWILITIPLLLIVAFVFEIRKKYIPIKKETSPQSSALPCYQCQYFNQNPYIKCAVNPVTALTKEASDCKDFQPKQDPSQ
ncbi:hypothetical protein PCC7424_4405 [Gloeothece citriformis PCC 7424]|uniref:Uncharacterized protein n=1 Tax=Gloeothece citriformis (strain PCC 7424) TaxID=65393 RepID=B7K900_GLOC7|nr:hypothetical protein [Gloeothece citriformis]ACK72769.1 hypothetical protein PCC7424_4405 [Gloeothece citriformis PCC 7424]